MAMKMYCGSVVPGRLVLLVAPMRDLPQPTGNGGDYLNLRFSILTFPLRTRSAPFSVV